MKTANVRIGGYYMTMIGGTLRPVVVVRETTTRPINGNGRRAFIVRASDAYGRNAIELPKPRTAAALRMTRAQVVAEAIIAWGQAIAAQACTCGAFGTHDIGDGLQRCAECGMH